MKKIETSSALEAIGGSRDEDGGFGEAEREP